MYFVLISLQNWTQHQLHRTLFDVPVVPSEDFRDFPINAKYLPLEKLSTKPIQWISKAAIDLYFDARMANKGNEKGRRLFMCGFVKNCTFYENKNDVFFNAKCCAEMKKSVEYDVHIHVNNHDCLVMKSKCGCPAGMGPNAACKHVGALFYGIEFYAITGEFDTGYFDHVS